MSGPRSPFTSRAQPLLCNQLNVQALPRFRGALLCARPTLHTHTQYILLWSVEASV